MFALAKYHFLDSNHGGFEPKRGYKANAIGKQQTSQVNRGGQIIAVKQRTPHVLGNDENDQHVVEISGVVDSTNGPECTPGEQSVDGTAVTTGARENNPRHAQGPRVPAVT